MDTKKSEVLQGTLDLMILKTLHAQKQLEVETENWERISGVVGRVLRQEGER